MALDDGLRSNRKSDQPIVAMIPIAIGTVMGVEPRGWQL